MKIKFCTLTGVDRETDLDRVSDLSAKYPFSEWGVLYSPSRQGEPGRYMSTLLISSALHTLPSHVKVALHICGQGIADLIAGEKVVSDLVELVANRGGRIQLNFNARRTPVQMSDLRRTIAKLSPLKVITQHNVSNTYVWSQIPLSNHQVLFDSSGGNGVKCAAWPNPLPLDCGYAGGLGPGTMARDLDDISRVAQDRETWVDMEGRLRMNQDCVDVFSLDLCEQVLSETSEWMSSRANKMPV